MLDASIAPLGSTQISVAPPVVQIALLEELRHKHEVKSADFVRKGPSVTCQDHLTPAAPAPLGPKLHSKVRPFADYVHQEGFKHLLGLSHRV